jgi:hypothetical protein
MQKAKGKGQYRLRSEILRNRRRNWRRAPHPSAYGISPLLKEREEPFEREGMQKAIQIAHRSTGEYKKAISGFLV